MSDQTTDTTPRLSPDDISELLRTFAASGWTGMRLTAGDVTIAVGKDAAPPEPAVTNAAGANAQAAVAVSAAPAPAPQPAPVVAVPAAKAPAVAPPAAAEIDETGLTAVTSPTVGAFWTAPDPGSAPFVTVGSQVAAGDQLGIVEVMKLMNPVITDVAGEVVAIRAANAAMVEFGQTLFLIRPHE